MNVKSLLAVAVLAAGAAHAGENLLNNGHFSSGTSAWTKVGLASATAVADDGIGAPSVELTTSTSGSSGQGLYQCVAVTPGTSYRVSGYLKRTSAAQTTVATVGVAVAFYGAPYCGIGSILGGDGQTVDPDTLVVGNWTPFRTDGIVAPAGSAYALVGVGADGANAAAYAFRADTVFFGLNDVIFEDGFEQ